MKKTFLALGLFLFSTSALAYLPPSFYFYEKISTSTVKTVPGTILLSVARPMSGGNEESLGTFAIPNWTLKEGGWPALSLLFLNDQEQLISAVEKFGIPVSKEKELLRASKEQAAAMKEAPRPFYFRDKKMHLKRFRNINAWVHGVGPDLIKSIWVEKDTWTPIKISAPCPDKVDSLPWVKSGSNKCDLEFRNVGALRRGALQSAKIILYRDGAPALSYSVEKLLPKGQSPGETTVPDDIREISSQLFH